jgi:hypothetical protein
MESAREGMHGEARPISLNRSILGRRHLSPFEDGWQPVVTPVMRLPPLCHNCKVIAVGQQCMLFPALPKC